METTENTEASHPRSEWRLRVTEGSRYPLAVLGVAAACVCSAAAGGAIPVEVPVILLGASVLLWFSTDGATGRTLQKIVGAYLCCAPVNDIMDTYARIHFADERFEVSWGVLALGLSMLGYWAHWAARAPGGRDRVGPADGDRLRGWGFAFVVLVAHIVVLAAVLNACYGYGYERSFTVFGRICLYYLMCRAIWPALGATRWRRCTCVVLLAYYGAITAGVI